MISLPKRMSAGTALIGAAWLAASCTSSITSSDLARVSRGMKVTQVESLLGRPTRIEQAEIADMSGVTNGQVYHYQSERGDAQVVFFNDGVFKTGFVAGGNQP